MKSITTLSLTMLQAHLVDGRATAGAGVDSARQNLAATFVNGFVNAGFGVVCCPHRDTLGTF